MTTGYTMDMKMEKKGMFNHVGRKIKKLVKILCLIEIALFVIGGIVIMFVTTNVVGPLGILIGILVAGLGSFFSWIGSFFIYGFGELVENSTVIAKRMQARENRAE